MIKTKEDILNTYVKNPCEALEILYLTICEGFGIKWRLGQQPCELQGHYKRFGVDKKTNSLCVDVEGVELTLADFLHEEEKTPSPEANPTKESLTGIKVRINGRGQWGRMKELCESVGLELATWSGCDFNDNTDCFMCGHEGKFIATSHWEETEDFVEEFTNLREVQYGDLFVVEEKEQEKGMVTGKYKYSPVSMDTCLFSLKKYFESGDLFVSGDCVEFYPVENQTQLAEGFHTITLYTREEVKWQDEVLDYLRMPSVDGFEEELPTKITVSFDGEDFYLTDSEFLEAARVALKVTGELVC
ncbi:hypothetical protein NVP1187O_161 [Vibrio phage 1.187.O._10N.286.49.F1]|nr:hypothetical protein NVP1187O_161 [Vibrio phage 1.187.O._10N.286.49.F1]